jgi:ATPase subunit of ABC transporter with duplicated ATPase domains
MAENNEFGMQEFKFPHELEEEKNVSVSAEEDRIEIEIDDDTPEQDRGVKPMPKEIVQKLEEDELDKYSAEAKEKLAQLKKVWHDERREKEAALREQQEAVRVAQRLLDDLEDVGQSDKVAKIRFPDPAPCGKTPLMASGLSKSYGSLEIFTAVDLAIDRGSKVVIIGLNGAGKTTLLRMLAGIDKPDTGQIQPGHGLKIGYYAQEHETLDVNRTVLENMQSSAPHLGDVDARKVLGSFLFSGDDVNKKAAVLSGGEKTRLALASLVVSSANVLLLDEPTNNLDPASRKEILSALASFTGAVVLVSHDEGAVLALNPERVLILPDGTEDHWSDQYADLISLS